MVTMELCLYICPRAECLGFLHWRFAFRHSAALTLGTIERNLFQPSAVVNRWNSCCKLVCEEELTTAECCGIASLSLVR